MDNWNREDNHEKNDQNVTVSGQFASDAQGNYQQNNYGQNGWQQNNYGQDAYRQNGYQQNTYGQSQGNAGGYGQPYAGCNQPPYQGYGYFPAEQEEPVGIGEWAGLLALASFVPIIGIILMIVWAFSKTEKKSKSNFCKAYLIIWLIKLALVMILFIMFGAALVSAIR